MRELPYPPNCGQKIIILTRYKEDEGHLGKPSFQALEDNNCEDVNRESRGLQIEDGRPTL